MKSTPNSFPIHRLPPMRPVSSGNQVVTVFPFYRHRNWIAYRGRAILNPSEIRLASDPDFARSQVPVETPGAIAAIRLDTLYNMASRACKGEKCNPALFTCRDSTNPGLPGFLSGVIFLTPPNDRQCIHMLVGYATKRDGSCSKSQNASNWWNLSISLMVVSEQCGTICPAQVVQVKPRRGDNLMIVINLGNNRLEAKARNLVCLPVYPEEVRKGNKYYPVTITGMLRPSDESPAPGSVIEVLVGSLLVSKPSFRGRHAMPLVGGRQRSGFSWLIPSPALQTGNKARKRWHEHALTRLTARAPIFSYKVPSDRVIALEEAVANAILEGVQTSKDIFIHQGHNYIVKPDWASQVINRALRDFKPILGKNYARLLMRVSKMFDRGVRIGFLAGFGSSISKVTAPVDPKLVVKALQNSMVSYPALYGVVDKWRKAHRRVSQVSYFPVALIGHPLSSVIAYPHSTTDRILYVHSLGRLGAERIMATLFLASLTISGSGIRRDASKDIGALLAIWLLLAAATVEATSGLGKGDLIVDLRILAKLIAKFALMAGIHGLAHVAVEAIADSLGVTEASLKMREFSIVPNDGSEGVSLTPPVAYGSEVDIIIDSAILLGKRVEEPEILVAVREEGMYGSLVGGDPLGGFDGLCRELHARIGHGGASICQQAWALSRRSLQAALSSAPRPLSGIAQRVLAPFSSSFAFGRIHELYYPQHEVALYMLERLANEEIKMGRLTRNDLVAYAAQLVKEAIPHCYDGCEMCVMSDGCPIKPSPLQQLMVSKSAAHLLCSNT